MDYLKEFIVDHVPFEAPRARRIVRVNRTRCSTAIDPLEVRLCSRLQRGFEGDRRYLCRQVLGYYGPPASRRYKSDPHGRRASPRRDGYGDPLEEAERPGGDPENDREAAMDLRPGSDDRSPSKHCTHGKRKGVVPVHDVSPIKMPAPSQQRLKPTAAEARRSVHYCIPVPALRTSVARQHGFVQIWKSWGHLPI
ncbi:hypothetical protein GCM10027090_06910 [Sinomonas soli]